MLEAVSAYRKNICEELPSAVRSVGRTIEAIDAHDSIEMKPYSLTNLAVWNLERSSQSTATLPPNCGYWCESPSASSVRMAEGCVQIQKQRPGKFVQLTAGIHLVSPPLDEEPAVRVVDDVAIRRRRGPVRTGAVGRPDRRLDRAIVQRRV